MFKLSFSILGLLLFSTLGQAETFNQRGHSFLGVGIVNFNLDYQETQPAFNQKNNLTGLYLYTGVDFNEFFGSEVRFGFSNTASKTYPAGTLGFTVNAFTAYLFRFNWDMDTHWRITGLLGYTDAQITRKSTIAGINDKVSARGISYGASLSYAITQDFHMDIEYLSYWTNVDTGAGTTMSLNNLGLRMGYNF